MYELLEQELRGQNSHQRHVVFDTRRTTGLKLSNKCSHRPRVKNTRLLDLPRRQHIVKIISRPKEALPIRRPVGLFVALLNRGRNQAVTCLFQQMLLVENLHLESSRKLGGKLHDTIVQKWIPALDRIGHCHTVALRRKDVSRQQISRLEIFSPVE